MRPTCLWPPSQPDWWPCSILHERVGLRDGGPLPSLELEEWPRSPVDPDCIQTSQTVVLFSATVLRSCAVRIRSALRAHMSSTVEQRGRGGWPAGRFWCFIRNRSQMGAGQAEVYMRGTGCLPKQVSSISELSQHQTPCRGSCHRPRPSAHCPGDQASTDLCPSSSKN